MPCTVTTDALNRSYETLPEPAMSQLNPLRMAGDLDVKREAQQDESTISDDDEVMSIEGKSKTLNFKLLINLVSLKLYINHNPEKIVEQIFEIFWWGTANYMRFNEVMPKTPKNIFLL